MRVSRLTLWMSIATSIPLFYVNGELRWGGHGLTEAAFSVWIVQALLAAAGFLILLLLWPGWGVTAAAAREQWSRTCVLVVITGILLLACLPPLARA